MKKTNPVSVPTWVTGLFMGTVLVSHLLILGIAPSIKEYSPPLGGEIVHYIAAAIPFFGVLIVLEFTLIHLLQYGSAAAQYTLPDSFHSLSAGIVQQLFGKIVNPLNFGLFAYMWIYKNYNLFRIPTDNMVNVVLIFFFIDLCYYWLHRTGHEVALLWAGHSVHHNSDHYNLTTALRQSWFQSCYSWIFYLPLALFVDPFVYLAYFELNIWYQFWVHTCLVRRLGWLEWIFVTPSHHRVHHDRRVHKNFAGMFVIWDRLFGTFLDECDLSHSVAETIKFRSVGASPDLEEVCVFGTIDSPNTFLEGPFQFKMGKLLWEKFLRQATVFDKLKVLLKGPGWLTASGQRALPDKPGIVPTATL